jgi:lipopolysaccharide transport system ATP-binding protein
VSLREALRSHRQAIGLREVEALKNVSFTIRDGERVGVIGRNGAGKTTLLSLLAGITEPTSGNIEITGDVHAMLTIGAVLRDEASGRENIYLDGAVHGRSREEIDAHVEEVIAFSELEEFIDRPVRTYSSGMKARLAFSMGAFIEPDILIIDETLSVGDAFFSQKASRRMKEITKQGRIVIVVSHALGIIDDICDRCLWLDQGKLVMDGPAREVTKAYSKAVEQADESELAAKFDAGESFTARSSVGSIEKLAIEQSGQQLAGNARAFVPLSLIVHGQIKDQVREPDLTLSITRVDGRRIMRQRLSEAGDAMPLSESFSVRIDFAPLILGAGLYRFDITLSDSDGVVDIRSRTLEILDEEGQFGGMPLLYCPPGISASKIGEPS